MLNSQLKPYLSISIPKRCAQYVSCGGIDTVPPSAKRLNAFSSLSTELYCRERHTLLPIFISWPGGPSDAINEPSSHWNVACISLFLNSSGVFAPIGESPKVC